LLSRPMAMSCYPASASHAGRQSTPDRFVNALLIP
jgi:hypothetical protein